MKSLMMFFECMLSEFGSICTAETARDRETVARRVDTEGRSFLTITLGDYLSDFEESLSVGQIASTSFPSFGKVGGLPKFLSGFLKQVFDTSGKLLDEPSIESIRAIRQLTGFAKKIELPTTQSRKDAAVRKFIECDAEIGQWEDNISSDFDWDRFDSLSSMLYGQMFSNLEVKLENGMLLPKHGPGATADKLRGNAKYLQKEWTDRLEKYFPYGEYLIPNWRFLPDIQDVQFHTPDQERPVKITLVPKTLKTPRIIAIEPTAMQYAQQALMAGFEDEIAQDSLLTSLIGWKDQTANHRMALRGSLTGDLSTLDLSEASDRVSMLVVRRLLRNHSTLLGSVEACRSHRAVLPNGDIMPLRKFASMGSALCFPFEAMVFMIIVLLGIEAHHGRILTKREVKLLSRETRVYGDDIIVPTPSAESVVTHLEAFGLKVNHRKSFWTGKFRESCGKDFYDGHDVSYVKVRQEFPNNRQDAQEIISLASLRNQLYWVGLWQTVKLLDGWIERIIPFPAVMQNSSALGRHSVLGYETHKMDKDLQRPLVKAAVVHAPLPASQLDGYAALMKFFLRVSQPLEEYSPPKWFGDFSPLPDDDHLTRSGRPVSVDIRIRWTSPF